MSKKRNVFNAIVGMSANPGKWKLKESFLKKHEKWIDGILPGDADAGIYEEQRSENPLKLLRIIFVFCLAILIGKLYFLQIVNGENSLKKAEGNRVREKVIRAERGAIYDRNKTLLVKNVGNYEVSVIPSDLPKKEDDRNKIYENLAKIISMPKEEVKKASEEKGLTQSEPILIKKTIDRDTSLLLESKILDLPGVNVSVNPIRDYLDKTLLAHVLGYVGRISEDELSQNKDRGYHLTDYFGKSGIEKQYENDLRGKDGAKRSEVDASGKIVKLIGEIEPSPGKDLVLSIDYGLQQKMAESLQASLDKAKVKKGAAIALNPNNGEVLAMVNLPTYDGNLFSKGISEADFKKLNEDENQPLLARAILGQYPSGSIIKPLFAAAALEEKIINRNTSILSNGGIKIGDFSFPDWKPGGHGMTNVTKAIAESVNTFFYAISGGWENIKGLGADKMKLYLEKFGLGKDSGIDLPGESIGRIPDPKWKEEAKKEPWYLGDTYHFGIGQGDLEITPIQMAKAISAIANGGTLYKPRLVKEIVDSNDKNSVKIIEPQKETENVISKENIDIVKEGMRQTVTAGSARSLNDLPVPIAGKTGTAQYGANNEHRHAWFTSFAPYPNPEIVLLILVEGGGEGSEFAAPVAKDVYKYYFKK